MSILDNPDKLLEFCRDETKQNEVINTLLRSSELRNYIKSIIRSSVIIHPNQIVHDTILCVIRTGMKRDFKFEKNPISYIKKIAKNLIFMELHKKEKTHLPQKVKNLPR